MESSLLSREEIPLASRLSSSNVSFRKVVVDRPPLIIQRVPKSVRDSSLLLEKRYFEPDLVSIGPYYHHLDDDMEKIKEAVVDEFCRSALPPDQNKAETAVSRFLEAVRSILPYARSCYDDTFESIKDDEFANMMVVDGCFLLAVMAILARKYPAELEHSSWTHGRMLRIMKDILLFENQIPWAVMRKLMELWPVPVVDDFVSMVLAYFNLDVHVTGDGEQEQGHGATATTMPTDADPPRRCQMVDLSPSPAGPAHLLDLVHQRYLGLLAGPAPEDSNDDDVATIKYCDYARPFAHFTSAVELAEAGIYLHGSGTCRVKDVKVQSRLSAAALLHLRIGQLVLPPLSLSWLPRCWLINMVAMECVTDRSDRSGVSSYLAILGSLVRSERDVEELRSRRILFSTMSDRRTVEFFEGLLDPLPRQELYLRTLEEIVQLRTRRSIRSAIHAAYYRNRKIILAVAPLLSLLVAIIGIVVTNSIKHK